MRGMILLVGAAVAAVAITMLVTRQDVNLPRILGGSTSIEVKPSPASAEPAKKPEPADLRNRRKLKASVETTQLESPGLMDANRLPAAETALLEPAKRFPRSQELDPGMLRSQIIEKYGDPNLRTFQTRNSALIERYVYVNRERNAMTVALLENGRAVRSETGPY